jgi:hypothetical protein
MKSPVDLIIRALLEDDGPVPDPTKWGRRVRVRKPDGQIVLADWNGYWDMRDFGLGLLHSIASRSEGGTWTHGTLHPGEEILDEVPSYEQWKFEKEARDKASQ